MMIGLGLGVTAPLKRSAGGSPSGIQPLSSYWETETNAFDTATDHTLTNAEKFAIDRFIKYCKFAGFWTRNASNANAGIWLTCQGTEAKSLINLLHPGTKDLVKNGVPTFAAFDGITSAASTDFYDTGIGIQNVSQNSCSLGVVAVSNNAAVANGYEIGAIDAGGTARFTLMCRNSTNQMSGSCMGATITSVGAATDYNGASFRAYSRTGSANFGVFSPGVRQSTQANASIAPVGPTTITVLKANGLSAAGPQKIALAFVLDGLSDAEMAYFHGACRTLVDGFRRGLPNIQPAGYGDATVTKDLIVYGDSIGALTTAYEAKRQGLSVAIVTPWLVESVEQLFGMVSNGLGWVDGATGGVTPFTEAIFREMGIEINARNGSADSNDQGGMSLDSKSWNIQCRKMLDPTRSTGNMPGLDIPVYFSSGINSISKDGGTNKITHVITVDGRQLDGTVYADDSYDGDLVQLSGVPTVTGREANGTSLETGGWDATAIHKFRDDATANQYTIDPYVTPATPASGFLPYVEAMPSNSAGAAYDGMQENNFRLMATSTKARRAPFVGGTSFAQPANYNAAKYEIFARYCAACTAAGHTVTPADIATFTRGVGSSGQVFDLNNNQSPSLDNGGSGVRYAAAGTNILNKQAEVADLIAWARGLIYFIATTADSRVTAHAGLQTAFLSTWGLEASNFVDMVSWKPLYWPGLPYRREPIWMLNNAANGGFRYTANDAGAANASAPRSGKTVSTIKYSGDHHAERWVAVDDGGGMSVQVQGGFSFSTMAGANLKAPIPMECVMPNKADCPNLLTSTCLSMTKIPYSGYRMERAIASTGQANGIIAKLAVAGAIAVQDVDYTTVRTTLLATPESVAPDLPTLN